MYCNFSQNLENKILEKIFEISIIFKIKRHKKKRARENLQKNKINFFLIKNFGKNNITKGNNIYNGKCITLKTVINFTIS